MTPVLRLLDEKLWERWLARAEESKKRLSEQQIAPGSPGTILTDIETMLEFVRPDGVVTRSRNSGLPFGLLSELNQKSSHPIELPLKRPLLRDYPNLAGIFVLLRVMDLLQMRGDRLVVAPAGLERWRRLNMTEKYFSLLEALLFHAEPSVLGGSVRNWGGAWEPWQEILSFLMHLTERWRDFERFHSASSFGAQGLLPPWSVFLQQQLDLIEVRSQPPLEKKGWNSGGRGWALGGARLTPWGTAVTWALIDNCQAAEEQAETERKQSEPDEQRVFSIPSDLTLGSEIFDSNDNSTEIDTPHHEEESDESDESELDADYGLLQPLFQPYFPEWQAVYALPELEVRSGTHVFKVTLAGWQRASASIWRRLAVPTGTSLDDLAHAILCAFELDDDHLYDFRYRDLRGRTREFNHPATDEPPFTGDIMVSETELAVKDEMRFTFDYGDTWQFRVRLEKIEEARCRLQQPKVVESEGKPPRQYPAGEW
jgi:hypothetical protein